MQETILNGRYRLGQEIGEGGMSVVYRGHDLLLNRPVAIKVLRAQYAADENFLKRFEREAQSAAGLSHPNIVNVYDVGRDGDTHYIVMEYIRGPSLKDLIRRQGPFSVDGAIFIISQVASALDYAHQRGLIHRDIKPQNILVDREGNAKVVDFGIAKGMRDLNLTEAGTGMGTVHYVSPEQARGEPATPPSDLYSTGVVLYEMLTKRLPFEADTPVGVAMQHVNAPPPRPSTFNPAIPLPVEAIVLRALAKEPQDRFASGAALSNALRHWDAPAALRGNDAAIGGQQSGHIPVAPPRATTVIRPPRSTPPRPQSRGRGGRDYPPDTGARRDDVGCATWLIGAAILLGILGLVVLAFRLGPNMFDSRAVGVMPTATPAPPPVAAAPTATLTATPSPTAEPTITATATIAVTPTATVTPTVAMTSTLGPTATPEALPVPQLANATLEQARTAAITGAWQINVTAEDFSDTIPAGQIISQDPPANIPLPRGATINVIVSKGSANVPIEDVRGLAAADAQAILEDSGFVVTRVSEPSTTVNAGAVIRTEPTGTAAQGSEITLVVSAGDVVVVPDVFRMNVQQAAAALTNAGLSVRAVSAQSCAFIRRQDPSFDCQTFPNNGVVSGTPTWGATVPRGTPIDIAYYQAGQ